MKHVILFLCALSFSVFAIEGFYLGVEGGYVGPLGKAKDTYNSALGFGADIGVKASPIIDLTLLFQTSSHAGGGGLNCYMTGVSADFTLGRLNDFEFALGGGPALYLLRPSGEGENRFGIHFGGHADVLIDERVHVGLGLRYHAPFSAATMDSFWTIMARVGYQFGSTF
ncbi:MAG: hypothetical protein HY537_03025 [Deltaproteobacteria bacterium]|nr:hypothetical protein [Deltaproteobacteria bacterium]